MLRTSFSFFVLLIPCVLFAQPFWTEDFGTDPGGCASAGQSPVGFNSGNGVWSVTETGVNQQFANVWYVSATEAGMGEGNCGDGCGIDATLTNNTLHLSTDILGDLGAAYLETGGGLTGTNIRAESPLIDCSGQTDIELSFLYLTAGNPPSDACFVEYFDGTAWSELSMLSPTALTCAPQGVWTSITFNLPASADNNPGIRIGFRWQNLDDGIATDPSVAIDDIALTGSVVAGEIVAGFTVSDADICAGDCVDFTDTSIGDNIDTWEWTFAGAETASSGVQNPTEVCYDTPGTYAVTLTVSSPDGTDDLTINDFITVSDCAGPPVADFTVNLEDICVGECVDFIDLSIGDGIDTWVWTFDGAETATSNDQNPVGICYETAGSYSVTLVVESPDGSDELTINNLITVDECAVPPTADFTVNIQNICEGDCINFSDLSEGSVDQWEWEFAGADTPNSGDQNPQGVCYSAAGSYDVTLTVTNALGSDVMTLEDFIVVAECDGPIAGFTAVETTICEGECVDFINQSIGGATIFSWTFEGADVTESMDENPAGICYATAGQYDVTLEVSDGTDTDIITIENFITVEDCPTEPLPDISISASNNVICVGGCVSFEDETQGDNISGWSWSFPGGSPATSSNQNPAEVCYLNQGSFDVTVVDTCGPVANFDYTPIVCLGQCYSFTNTSTGGSSYFWTFEGGLPETSEEFSPGEVCYLNQTGTFNVTLTVVDQFGSSTSITQQITVVNPPVVNAGPDQTIIQGTTANLSAIGGNGTGQFLWQPFEDVVCFDCPATSTYPLNETTTFVVYYEQSGGCQNSDTVTVFVEEVQAFGVPGSFSPNGDGVNDILYVRGTNITKLKFIVYNRYGQMVFESYSTKDGWDGTMNGRQLNAGVFGYYIEAFFTDGSQNIIKGDVTLVR